MILGSIIGLIVVISFVYYIFISSTSQLFGYFPYRVKNKGKVIALTFDDGPNDPWTSQLLDILENHKVKATFFLCGENAKKFPETVKRMVKNGHVIGDHLMTHHFPVYFDSKLFEKELVTGQQTLKTIAGLTPILYRPPWLMRTPRMLEIVKKHQMTTVSGLFINWIEMLRPPAKFIAFTGSLQARPGVILDAHDGNELKGGSRQQTIEAVNLLIPVLKKRGYSFVTVDQLLSVPAYQET